jgi:hypothetical protein
MKTMEQTVNMLKFAIYVLAHRERLGVGLKNRCYAGIAIAEARKHQSTVKDYYGMPLKELKTKIKINNRTEQGYRNLVMFYHSVRSIFA